MQVGAEQHLRVRMHVAAGPHLVTVSFPRDVWEDESVVLQPPVQARSMGDAVNAERMGFAGFVRFTSKDPTTLRVRRGTRRAGERSSPVSR